jgi:predicted nucleotidyltransferase
MESFQNDLKKALQKITSLFKSKKIKFSIIGGAALTQYGNIRLTQDIDILVDKSSKEKLLSISRVELKPKFQGTEKSFILQDPKTEIDIIYTGDKTQSKDKKFSFYYDKIYSNTIDDVPYTDIKHFLYYKIGVGRTQDIADVESVIKHNDLSIEYMNEFDIYIKEKYKEIWNDIKGE